MQSVTKVKLSGSMTRDSSQVTTAFTPINHSGPGATEYGENSSVPLSETSTNIGRKRAPLELDKTSVEKRYKTAISGSCPIRTKQLPIAPRQTPTPTGSLRLTQPIIRTKAPATTIEQLTTHGSRTSQISPDPPRLEAIHPYNHSHEQSIREATINKPAVSVFIPCTQESIPKAIDKSDNVVLSSPIVESSSPTPFGGNTANALETVDATHNVDASDEQSDSSDSYPLDDGIIDDDILQLLPSASGFVQETHIPPSSVRGWDHESRSATEYDSTLKYTPPDPQEADTDAACMGSVSTNWQGDNSEDLLDEEVDWNAVMANVNAIQEDSSVDLQPEVEAFECGDTELCSKGPSVDDPHSDKPRSSTAFVRPAFPDKVRDRALVPGMSSNTVLRTCFRIGVLISQTACCFNHQQDVIFELYARVTYSSRETLARKQHFQFVDLCKDQQPYPAATFSNWRVGSQQDYDSAAFLDTSGGPRLCRCVCKPIRDLKAAIGWTYIVLSIKEVDWEQIQWAKRIICGESEEAPAEIAAMKP
ncbi:hypothetical protein F5Y10DRAFT_291134 [Nemania abortiva]|nr:hypothetical protein F5Y10DRAFT_291134 [Nemania abortiva]